MVMVMVMAKNHENTVHTLLYSVLYIHRVFGPYKFDISTQVQKNNLHSFISGTVVAATLSVTLSPAIKISISYSYTTHVCEKLKIS